jgi:hypothetical protein
MSDTFPLLLKEGWPDHHLIMIPMLMPAGVVDFLFKFRIFLNVRFKGLKNYGTFFLNSIWSNRFFMSIKV